MKNVPALEKEGKTSKATQGSTTLSRYKLARYCVKQNKERMLIDSSASKTRPIRKKMVK